MAKKVKGRKKKSQELQLYKKSVARRIDSLMPIFASASIGDFSTNVKLPNRHDEFAGLYVGIQIMLEVIREKITTLEELNRSLEQKLNRFTLAENEELFVGTLGKLVRINVRDILFVKAAGDYVSIVTLHGRHTVHSTMKKMLNKLPAKEFTRVHHSYIVRIDRIDSIEHNSVSVGRYNIPISRSRKKGLLALLRKV